MGTSTVPRKALYVFILPQVDHLRDTKRHLTGQQALQAMDNSHVALVSLKLLAEQFESYRCDRNMPLGVNVSSYGRLLPTFAPAADTIWLAHVAHENSEMCEGQ